MCECDGSGAGDQAGGGGHGDLNVRHAKRQIGRFGQHVM